jgi:hypothetical protein
MGKLLSKSRCFVIILAAAAFFSAFSVNETCFAAEPANAAEERFKRSFGTGDFKVNRDALKHETPENGMYKVTPRVGNAVVWTRFALPEDAWRFKEWIATAVVNSSEGSGTGVGLWSGENCCVLFMYPDGRGVMRYYEGKKTVWGTEVKTANFSYPARISLFRDSNGSMLGMINGAVVASRLLAVDLKKTNIPKVTAVSFATFSRAKPEKASVLYERLDVEAWGLSDLAKELDTAPGE